MYEDLFLDKLYTELHLGLRALVLFKVCKDLELFHKKINQDFFERKFPNVLKMQGFSWKLMVPSLTSDKIFLSISWKVIPLLWRL